MGMANGGRGIPIERIGVSAYVVPADGPEADGTFAWHKTTLVLVEATADGKMGLGYSYADTSTAALVRDTLAEVVRGRDAMAVPGSWSAMVAAIRNLGRPGVASMAISAIDAALWDLKARLLELPLVTLLGSVHEEVPVYGSGGFTSYSIEPLQKQLGGWVEHGIARVKMKIGTHPDDDLGLGCCPFFGPLEMGVLSENLNTTISTNVTALIGLPLITGSAELVRRRISQ
jgi:L-alanine-DL-glutamate epimerase-like enolase superfamily enzyme